MVLVVAVVGRSGSGKTVTIEYLVNCLSGCGYRVGVVKHVHHKGFTVDTEGKDTWRYAKVGAKIVAAVSPDEVAIIKKTVPEINSLDQVIEFLKNEELDIIFVEGYRDLVVKRVDVLKILTAKDTACLHEVLDGTVEPILAVSGLIVKNVNTAIIQKHPIIKIPEEGKQLVNLIKQQITVSKNDQRRL
jgi:molybdopterin-guanine dinucleotide biosynthesis protein B